MPRQRWRGCLGLITNVVVELSNALTCDFGIVAVLGDSFVFGVCWFLEFGGWSVSQVMMHCNQNLAC